MTQIKKNIDTITLKLAKRELTKIPESKTVIQLKAIIISGNYPVNHVAEIFGVSSRTVFRWIEKFKSKGLEGLKDKPKGHLRSKLTEIHKKKIETWIVSGKDSHGKKIRWTLGKLKAECEKDFEINISTTALWNHLKKMNVSIKK